jgi:SAM-dependent methyltransferase
MMGHAAAMLSLNDDQIARLEPTTVGVNEAVAAAHAQVARGYHRERMLRLLGMWRRTAADAWQKYERIAGQYQETESKLSPADRKLMFVGSDIRIVSRLAYLNFYRSVLADMLVSLNARTIVEVGAGELNTLLPVARQLAGRTDSVVALDISEKRLAVGRALDVDRLITDYVVASADRMPFADRSFDVVFTSHCLEQSPELLKLALREFARVARRHILLAEPAYELAHKVQRRRIRRKGYVRGIPDTARRLGFTVVSHELMPVRDYLNGTAITLIAV